MDKNSTKVMLIITASFASCATTSTHKPVDIFVPSFDGEAGNEVKQGVEARLFRLKDTFRVIASDSGTIANVQNEAVKGKQLDDPFMKPGGAVKLREGLSARNLLHGTCHQSKEKKIKKVLNGWFFGAFYPGEFLYDYKLYCTYRLVDAETHVQKISGDSEAVEWTSESEFGPPDPDSVRKIATQIVDDIQEKLKE